MNLNEIKTFLAIIETGSLVRASARLSVTQSTVTARLKSLEQALGQPLIQRQKSGATLTAAGERLRKYADTMNDLWTQARQEIALPDGLSAMCNMASEPDLWHGLAADMFQRIRSQQPGVAVSVWQSGPGEIATWLGQGVADIAITYQPAHDSQMMNIDLPPDILVLVSTRANGPVRFDPGYVFVAGGEAFQRTHAAAFADAATARLSFGNAQLGLAHILAEGGSAYIPQRLAAPHIAKGRLHILDAPQFQRPVFLVAHRQATANWSWFEDCVSALQS